MAIGWLTVLKMVPWVEVIGKAPVLADGAKKLWKSVARKPLPSTLTPPNPAADNAAQANTPGGHEAQAQLVVTLQRRVATLEVATADLHEQMLASSELLKALAEQNTQLVRRIELNRVRLLWLAVLTLGLGVALLADLLGWP